MQQNIERSRTIKDLAHDLNVGRRTLERRFLADPKQAPMRVCLGLRLERAMQRLRSTPDPIADIAPACGFCDVPQLRSLEAERRPNTGGRHPPASIPPAAA